LGLWEDIHGRNLGVDFEKEVCSFEEVVFLILKSFGILEDNLALRVLFGNNCHNLYLCVDLCLWELIKIKSNQTHNCLIRSWVILTDNCWFFDDLDGVPDSLQEFQNILVGGHLSN